MHLEEEGNLDEAHKSWVAVQQNKASTDSDLHVWGLLGEKHVGELDDVRFRTDDVFGVEVPVEVPGVVSQLLDPRSTWRDPKAYDIKAQELAWMFRENFEKFAADADEAVAAAGPRV